MTTLVVVGYNAWDVRVPLSAPLPADGKVEVAALDAGGGGPAATAAVALARLGARARLVTALADDPFGAAQRAELLAEGVDLAYARPRAGAASPLAVILVAPGGQRAILWRRGDLPPLAPDEVDAACLDGAGALLCDTHEPAAATALARAARARGRPVVLDAGNVRPGVATLVPLCTDVVGSTGFASALCGEPDPVAALRALARLGPARVATTYGTAGCLTLVAGEPVHVPAFRVTAVDTTGAGDAFHAGYALARAEGRDAPDALAWGAAVAALKCRALGGRRGLPRREEVEALLRRGERRAERPAALPD